MEILGVGPSELVFIVIIALIVLGPKDMQKAGKTIGKFLRDIITSDGWKIFQQTSRELRTLPNKLMREANDELNQIGNQVGKQINSASNPTIRHGERETSRQDDASQRVQTPNMPPRSQPFPAPSAPAKPAKNMASSSGIEQKENESDQPIDA